MSCIQLSSSIGESISPVNAHVAGIRTGRSLTRVDSEGRRDDRTSYMMDRQTSDDLTVIYDRAELLQRCSLDDASSYRLVYVTNAAQTRRFGG